METAFLRALPLMRKSIPLPPVVLTGPGTELADRRNIEEEAKSIDCSAPVLASVQEGAELTRRAEVVITMGGYNSICEILRHGKKSLVTPRPTSSYEQFIRNRIFVEQGLIRSLPPEGLTPEEVARGLISLYQADTIPNRANLPKFDGAQRAAAVILGEE